MNPAETNKECYEVGNGSPESKLYRGPSLYFDRTAGELYTKTTPEYLGTGWVKIATE